MTARPSDTHAAVALSTRGGMTAGSSGTRAAAMTTTASIAKRAGASSTWSRVKTHASLKRGSLS